MAADGSVGPHVVIHPQSEGGACITTLTERRVADGLAFVANYSQALGAAASAATLILTTPATSTGRYHLIAKCEAKKAGTFTFSEVPNVTAGSAITAINTNRLSSTASGVVVKKNVTWTSSGTILETHVVGGISGPFAETGQYILGGSTRYLGRFVADTTTTLSTITFYVHKES
jgi:hypothetical protein